MSDRNSLLEKAILSAINTEIKQSILGFCLDDGIKTESEIRKSFLELTQTWCPHQNSLKDYMRYTFVPTGLVDAVGGGWKLSKVGKKYGRPIAAFSLKYATEKGVSLYSILGKTSSDETSSPFNRIMILKTLFEGSQRETDLAQKLALHKNSICLHLKRLKDVGFVSYDSVEVEKKGWARYRWVSGTPDDVKGIANYPSLTKKIARYLYEYKEADYAEISKILGCSASNASTVLAGLERQGVISSRWVGGKRLSEAAILEAGKEFVKEYVEKIEDALSDGPELESMERLYEELKADKVKLRSYVHEGIELYKRVSPYQKIKPKWEKIRDVIEFVRQFEDHRGPRTRDIVNQLNVSARQLKEIVGMGYLLKEKEGRETRYRIPKSS